MKTVYKNGVKPMLTNDAWVALIVCINLAEEMGAIELRITSTGRDRKPGQNFSFHFCKPFSQAFDFTIIGVDITAFNKEAKRRLALVDCDYVYHNAGSGFHGHVEHDPKK